MKLVSNWKRIATRSWSMIFVYLGLMAWLAPTVIFTLTGVQTDPNVWAKLALTFLALGGVGRLVDQGIGDGKS